MTGLQSSDLLLYHSLKEQREACIMLSEWNSDITSPDDYMLSPEGTKTLAASCMIIESLGEGVKKIDRHFPNFLESEAPEFAWKELKGMRDHIAHGYFKIDTEVVFDVVKNEIPLLIQTIDKLLDKLNNTVQN